MFRHNPVYDTMESYVWGNQWQWGYDKHPPFTAWITAIFGNLTNQPDLGIYLLAQLCIVVTFLAVWRLAKEYLNDQSAVLSVLMLTGILHYSNLVERVTPDSMQSPVWALLALSFYFAIEKKHLRYWIATGLLTGFAILTKYQVVVLIVPMTIALLASEKGIPTLKTLGPWLAILIAFLVITPHIFWLLKHNFPSIQYLSDQYTSDSSLDQKQWTAHLKAPLHFAINSLGNVILLLFVCWPLFKAPKINRNHPIIKREFKLCYLICLALGPMITSIIIGAWNAEDMVPRWSTPYFAWLPLLILMTLSREISRNLFNNIIIRCFLLALTLWFLRISFLYYKPYKTDDYWHSDEFTPALDSMRKAESLWKEHYDNPLPYIGGNHYHIMGMVTYSTNNTIPFSNLNPKNSLWMTEEDFRKYGGIIALEMNINEISKETVGANYPTAIFLGTFTFRPHVPEDIDNMKYSIVSYYLLPPINSKQ